MCTPSLVWDWLGEHPRFDITDLDQFKTLLKHIGDEIHTPDDDALAVVVAMCVLSPFLDKTRQLPMDKALELYDLLIIYAPSSEKERIEKCVDFAIAYGCGWQRQMQRSRIPSWNDEWLGAFYVLEMMIWRHVHQGYEALNYEGRGGIRGFSRCLETYLRIGNDSQEGSWHGIENISALIKNTPRGAGARLKEYHLMEEDAILIAIALRDGVFNKEMPKYRRFHALAGWHFHEYEKLDWFLKRSVQGECTTTKAYQVMNDEIALRITKANSFGYGLLYQQIYQPRWFLGKDGVEFQKCELPIHNNDKRCPACNIYYENFNGKTCPKCQSSLVGTKPIFEDGFCPKCRTNLPRQLLRKGNLEFKQCELAIHNNDGLCPKCGVYYDDFNGNTCPKCQETLEEARPSFEGDVCPRCQSRFDETQSRRISKTLLYSCESYNEKKYKRCANSECGNYFPEDRTLCPLCHGQPTRQCTTLLIHDPIVVHRIEELDNDQRNVYEALVADPDDYDLEKTMIKRLFHRFLELEEVDPNESDESIIKRFIHQTRGNNHDF